MLAKHLVGLYLEDRPQTAGTDIMVSLNRSFTSIEGEELIHLVLSLRQKIEDLSSYISFARNHIHPVLTPEASKSLVSAYVEMRNAGADARSNDRRITATTRQLESMIRLSEAHARMRYSESVEVQDVEEANRLIREALKESAVRLFLLSHVNRAHPFLCSPSDGSSHRTHRSRLARWTIDTSTQVAIRSSS